MSRKFKKLSLQYSFLLLEKEEVDDICLQMDKQINEAIKEKYPDEYESLFSSKTSPIEETKTIEEIEEIEEIDTKKKNNDIRKLYRKIAEKTHPDKTGDNSKAEMFSEASLAYQENNLATLLNLAGLLNIDLFELSPSSFLLLQNNITSLSEEINAKKNSASWAFYNAKSQQDKDSVINLIINQLKGSIK